jgi:pimeloyl-ACP methyl ester carboxylesterase
LNAMSRSLSALFWRTGDVPWRLFLVALFVFLPGASTAQGNPPETIVLGPTSLVVFTSRPAGCRPVALLVVIHGSLRDPENYRNYVRSAADRWCFLVVVPRFDVDRFPTARFGFCSLPDQIGQLLVRLVSRVREREHAPELPYIVLGHSSGGGAASCFAAFTPNEAKSIVIANPAGLLAPSRDVPVPFGFKGAGNGEALERYLAAPIVIFLSDGDTVTERHGTEIYTAARGAADTNHWLFGWTVTEAHGVGHWAGEVLVSPEAIAVLGRAAQ